MQEECISRIKEGIRFLDLHILAHTIAIEGLLELGIFRGGTVDEIRRSGASLVFFPHGLGHHVGLEVHDVSPEPLMAANYRGDEPHVLYSPIMLPPCTPSAPALKAGMVVTVEPGIYFSRLALDYTRSQDRCRFIDMTTVLRYMSVGGVRIEDDILVTKNGHENLTVASKGEEMLKIIQRGKKR
jgi:Xaa-Pro dipeptidase